MKKKLKKLIKRRHVSSVAYIEEAAENAPRITNQTVAEHREQVLSRARKYILPLAHSRKQIVTITTSLVVLSTVAFFTYCTLALYKFHNDSAFIYRVTQVIPFPVAKAGSRFVAYENYLFELRRYEHYYINQQKTDFADPGSRDQLLAYRKQALEAVINDAYVKQLAEQNDITVTDQEVTDAVELVRGQNRIGGSDKVFEGVLRDYWGWSVHDFRRSLHNELLSQKVASALDAGAHTTAQAALDALNGGKEFGSVAKQYSTDADTKNNNGEFGYPIDHTTRTISAQTVDALYKLKPGQISGVINNGSSLEIVKVIEVNNQKIRAAHIIVAFKDISAHINDRKEKQKAHSYIQV